MGRSVVDLAESLDGTGLEQEMLGERGLATAGVPRQDDASEMSGVDVLHRHRRSYLTIAAAGTIGGGLDSGLSTRPGGGGPAAVRP